METVAIISAGMGVAWASGVNLYATIFMLGVMGQNGYIDLPPELMVLESNGVIIAALVMYIVEFFADKIPGIDSGWDAIHTFIRIPAGAILAAQTLAPVNEEAQLIAFILGGAVAGVSHTTKSVSRLAINTSPEPFTNWGASIAEDVAAITGVWAAFNHPYLMLAFVILFLLFAVWFIPKMFALLKTLLRKIASFFGGNNSVSPVAENNASPQSSLPPHPTTGSVNDPTPPPGAG